MHFPFHNSRPKRRFARAREQSGFSRLEAVVTVGVLAMLSAVAIPVLAHHRSRSDLAMCMSNLGQIGKGVLSWNASHDNYDAWRHPAVLDRRLPSGLINNAWYHFANMSNELRSASILACPADAKAVPAVNFSGSPDGGLLYPGFRNDAISYFISLDTAPLAPQAVLAGDLHVRVGTAATSCQVADNSFISPAFPLNPSSTGWISNKVHGAAGNLLFHDGRVETRSSPGLRQAFEAMVAPQLQDAPGVWHLLIPHPL